MGKEKFKEILGKEVKRVDNLAISKRHERVIEGFTEEECPRAIISNKKYILFNSNDYLGLRFNKGVKEAKNEFSEKYGISAGAVRFISGTMKAHKDLEREIANFHNREDAIIFSSAFATNFGVLHSLIRGQSADSIVSSDVLVISDELNHRSIIDGIRVANISKEQKKLFKHLDYADLRNILQDNEGKFSRVLIITDGIFSMLGEAQNIKKIKECVEEYDVSYPEGIFVVMDDAHGVGCFGESGKGCEEVFGAEADILIGTLGKAFGVEGGYATGGKDVIDYFRESAATYIYSGPISPGAAGAAIASFEIMNSEEGKKILKKLKDNIKRFKRKMGDAGFRFVVNSEHAIQPILVGNTEKSRALAEELYNNGIAVTNINYPVIPRGKDEIRVQINALHTDKEIDYFVDKCSEVARRLGIL